MIKMRNGKHTWIYGLVGWLVIVPLAIGLFLVCLFLLPLRLYQSIVDGFKEHFKKHEEVPYHMRHNYD